MNAVEIRGQRTWKKVVAAIVLAIALVGLPALAASAPGVVQPVYACPLGGTCG